MNLKNYFDISRFWLLLKLELFRSRKGILMTFVITFGITFTGQVAELIYGGKKVFDSHPGSYSFALLIGGFIVSSLAFNDLSSTLRRYNYLTLPASALEKFLSMWLLTSVGWITLLTIAYTLYAFITNSIAPVFFGHVTFGAFEPMGENSMEAMKFYFVFQGIFLVGAAHFKGYVFPKTLFVLIIFAAFCGTVIYFMLADIFLTDHECSSDGECELVTRMGVHEIWRFTKLFWWLLAPLCWVITYLGLRDQEA